ncbi:nuclear factor NF-kappa-B p110 subunit isoform X1 [Galleria mellonella]|uniref:Nuclear factor NF-kappa-B p110 subunit isoform X1 n=1 Tax=Galleria mellonella TaxID=7137 RepID=A0ABM3ME74_GALME|nr:nuclear factor NF-kappa-B p110 subunit isoform X1 [Galleria mellonella]
MSAIGSDQDTESSNFGSPSPQSKNIHIDSPYSSPSQQVPQLAFSLNELSCTDKNFSMHFELRPFLRIVEQPQDYFRFRYKSEMVGTHGCLLGKSYVTNKSKKHPTIELVNYTGRAIIRCRLAQHDSDKEHPHKLLEDEQDRDVSYEVPEHGSYKVGFAGMGIIHTAKKDVPGLLYNKYASQNSTMSSRELRTLCENEAKNINLNIVRLRFSAHDINTNEEICPAVFSEPIHNMKSAATNDLKICRISRSCGRPRGGDDVYIFVEKVNKKNIKIRFFEVSESGEEVWSAFAHFLESDVHHQYAIVFRTPQYKDPYITVDVKVCIELVRPLDGRTSDAKEFTYKAEQAFKQSKKRKANSSYSSLSSNSGSIKSIGDVPATVMFVNSQANNLCEDDNKYDLKMSTFQTIPQIPVPLNSPGNDLGNALLMDITGATPSPDNKQHLLNNNPMIGQPNIPSLPDFNSAELRQILENNSSISTEDKKRFAEVDLSEYLSSFQDSFSDEPSSMNFLVSSMLVSDSGRAKGTDKKSSTSTIKSSRKKEEMKPKIVEKANSEYSASYTSKDGTDVKRLVAEICDIIRQKQITKKSVVRDKLEQLFERRLSNGDTFLHMTLCSNQPSLQYIVKLVHSMGMTHLLNLKNNLSQTVLHLAIVHETPEHIKFLVSRGCDPMLSDIEGNNAFHYAVCRQDNGPASCLEALLDTIHKNNVPHDLNATNSEKETPLHLAAMYDSAQKARILLQRGAACGLRDAQGRSPLHRAADMDHGRVLRELLHHASESDVNAADESGYTALQIVCGGGMKKNTLEMVKLLLDNKADPVRDGAKSAWHLAKEVPEIRAVIREHPSFANTQMMDDEIKSEPEDEDVKSEGEDDSDNESGAGGVDGGGGGGGLQGLAQYRQEVAALLDASGAWRPLAARLHLDSLLSWLQHTASPTATLLNYLKESGENITSKLLAATLDNIGQEAAAVVIRNYID